jgi:predicted ATPase
MKHFILTGMPGAGKTSIIEQLDGLGANVVPEAATEIIARQQAQGIAEPWLEAGFIDAIVDLQNTRLDQAAAGPHAMVFHDRSVFCTYALALYQGRAISSTLQTCIARLLAEQVFQSRVFFVGHLGSVAPSAARKITFADALDFEQVHREVYQSFGFELVPVAPAPVMDRAHKILSWSAQI